MASSCLLCATCGADATRVADYDWKTNNWGAKAALMAGALLSGGMAIAIGGKQQAKVSVPCCDAHEGGLLVKDRDKAELTVAVSSYRFFREYLKLNKLRPQGFFS
jgi:hypothetical protein